MSSSTLLITRTYFLAYCTSWQSVNRTAWPLTGEIEALGSSWQLLALGQKCSNECQTAEDQFTDDRLRGDFFKIWESPKPKFVMSRKESGGFGKVPNLRKHPWKRTRTQGKDYLYDLPFYMTFPWSSPLGPSSTLKSGASNGSGIHKPSTRRSLAHHVRDPFIHGTFLSHVPDRLFDSLRLKG